MILALALLAVIPAGQTFTCTPVAVWDGDGPIWCEEGPRIPASPASPLANWTAHAVQAILAPLQAQ